MPETIISPRVKTREVDQSFIPELPEQRTAMVVGVTKKGNFFTPQTVTKRNLSAVIGHPDFKNIREYTSLTAYNFLNGGAESVKVMPITALVGSTMGNAHVISMTVNTTDYEFMQLFPVASNVSGGVTVTVSGTLSSLTITVDGTDIITDGDFTDSQVVKDFYERFRDPVSSVNPVFVKNIVDINAIVTELGEDSVDVEGASVSVASSAVSTVDYQMARTPWILSQNGDKLFRFHSLSGSDVANRSLRFRISGIKKPSELGAQEAYGEFTIEIYSYSSNNLIGDSDRKRFEDEVLLESFTVSLDPDAENYIEKRIGNRREYFDETSGTVEFDGLYSNRSNFVRVEMATGSDSLPSSSLPWGFERYDFALNYFADQAPTIYIDPTTTLDGGINFSDPFIDFFHVEELSVKNSPSAVTENFSLGTFSTLEENLRKFTFGMFGGTQGLPDNKEKKVGKDMETTNTFGFDFTDTDTDGYKAYERALDILSDKEAYQFDVLFLAGLNLIDHETVISKAISMVEERGDAILFVDAGNPTSTDSAMKSKALEYDSSYASAFAPWLLSSENALIPPSTAFANSVAVNDRNFEPWYSLIGIERGRITGVSDVVRKYNMADRDDFVNHNINPIAKYKGNILIYGTETLQQRDTLLSQYPIRRLLIESKIRVSDVADFYIGKQFTDQMISSLNEEVTSVLSEIRDKNGLEDFSVEFDTSADLRDRGIVNGAIVLKPTTSVKGIVFTFKITNSGVDFNF